MPIDAIPRRAWFHRVLSNLRSFPRFAPSRKALVFACLSLVGIVGYIDYLTGYERSLLLFYLLPISLATWFGGLILGLTTVVISVAVWILADVAAAGIQAAGLWKLRTLVLELDRRVHERTAALQREVTERQRLDREIALVADHERRRLGREMHDSLGQHLTGTAL